MSLTGKTNCRYTDATRVRQILLNLVSNALKFSEAGQVRMRCSYVESGIDEPGALTFSVTDTGIGVTPQQMESLFQPFVQADTSTTRKFGGTGLGLTISQRLARLLGGDLTLQSQLGEGCTFTMTLPVFVCPPPANLGTPIDGIYCDEMPLHGSRVLLAEDGIDNQRLIRLFLERAGAEVTLVENGQQAVDQFAGSDVAVDRFDLILMDIQMPVMDGCTATRHIRGLGFQRRIIALTANAMSEDRIRCVEAGCDDFITKPIERERFLRRLVNHTQAIVQRV